MPFGPSGVSTVDFSPLSVHTVSEIGVDSSAYRDFKFEGFAIVGLVRDLELLTVEIHQGLRRAGARHTYNIFTPGTIPRMNPPRYSGLQCRQSLSGFRVIFPASPTPFEVHEARSLIHMLVSEWRQEPIKIPAQTQVRELALA